MGFDAGAVRHAYENLADGYTDQFGDDLHQGGLDSSVLDKLIEMLPATALTLDLGCGPAQVASYVTTRGCRAIGLDLTPAMLTVARHRAPRVALVNANVLEIPVRAVCVDAVVAWFSLHNLRRALLGATLDEIRRVLRRSGVFVMVTHAGSGEQFVTIDSAERTEQVVITYYEADELRATLDHHELEVVDIRAREPLDHEHAAPKLFVTAVAK